MVLKTAAPKSHSQEDHWIPLSDLMTGLMMVFMLVAIIFMVKVQRDAKRIEAQATAVKNIAVDYTDLRAQLYQDLTKTFKNDLPKWNAVLSPDLSLRFKEPSVQFDTQSYLIKPSFGEILDSFFPRYIEVLYSPQYRDAIEEVRIEGHTSSNWGILKPEQAYYRNMQLSQDRTRSVLEYVLKLPQIHDDNLERLGWLIQRLTANGLSSSKLILLSNRREDAVSSQRVEFRVRTNAEARLEKILMALPK